MNRHFIRTTWVVLIISTLGMVVNLWTWFADLISDRAMLGITLTLSWFALVIGCVSTLVTFYVKDDVE